MYKFLFEILKDSRDIFLKNIIYLFKTLYEYIKKKYFFLIILCLLVSNLNAQRFYNYENQSYVGLSLDLNNIKNYQIFYNKMFNNSNIGYNLYFESNNNIIIFNDYKYNQLLELIGFGIFFSNHKNLDFKKTNIILPFNFILGQEYFYNNNSKIETNFITGINSSPELLLKFLKYFNIGYKFNINFIFNYNNYSSKFVLNNFFLLKYNF